MKRLLRILYTIRGLILAGTLMIAAIGSYLDRGTAPTTRVNTHLASHVQAIERSQVPPQWRIGDPCPVAECFHYLDKGQVPLQ